MRHAFALVSVVMFSGCAMHAPEPAVSTPGAPHVSWSAPVEEHVQVVVK
jgi:hypothetical protein